MFINSGMKNTFAYNYIYLNVFSYAWYIFKEYKLWKEPCDFVHQLIETRDRKTVSSVCCRFENGM